MPKTIISLISFETVPNVEIIKEFSDDETQHIFITTSLMEAPGNNRSALVMMACKLKLQRVTKILVNPNSITEIENTLQNRSWSNSDEYIVNITGGTKLMAIACLSFFTNFPNARILYKYIGQNAYRQIFPRISSPEFIVKSRLSLEEYLTAYGLSLTFKEHNLKDNRIASELFEKCVYFNNNINEIPEILNARKYKSANNKSFYTGGWFEEYIYYQIKTQLQLNQSQIAMKVKIRNQRTNNEYDVVFVYQNRIYLVECKAYFSSSRIKDKLEEDLYKLGALDDDFGINARSVLITNFDLENYNRKENRTIMSRASDLKVGFLQMKNLKTNNFIKSQLNYES